MCLTMASDLLMHLAMVKDLPDVPGHGSNLPDAPGHGFRSTLCMVSDMYKSRMFWFFHFSFFESILTIRPVLFLNPHIIPHII